MNVMNQVKLIVFLIIGTCQEHHLHINAISFNRANKDFCLTN